MTQTTSKIIVVRVRSSRRTNQTILDTLQMLNLHKQNYCVIVDSTPETMGMVKKVKDYVTWGVADTETLALLEKKVEKNPRKPEEKKAYMRLNPPRKGYGRKGIKKGFSIGGALGNRKDMINDLVKRMI